MSSNVAILSDPTSVTLRILCGSNHETWMWAMRPSANFNWAKTTSSTPGCRYDWPCAVTVTGSASNRNRMIETSCGARLHQAFSSLRSDAQVHALAVHVPQGPEGALLEHVLQLQDAGVVLQQVADHEDALGLVGAADEVLGVGRRQGHRLLDEDVLAGGQGLAGQSVVAGGVGRDDHGLDLGVGEDLAGVGRHLDARTGGLVGLQHLRAEVADGLQATGPDVVKVADVILAPSAAADHRHGNHRHAPTLTAPGLGRRIDRKNSRHAAKVRVF